MNQQELRAASSIGMLYLVRMLGLFMVLPVLPLLAPEIPLATPLMIGLAIGIYGLTQALLQIPFGLLSDRLGRKPVIAAGLVLFIVGSLLAATANDIYGLILGRMLQGCGAIASTLLALMSDLTRVDQRSKSMAIIGIAIGGSFALSLILGPLISVDYGIAGIFTLSAVLGVIGLLLVAFVIPTPQLGVVNLDASLSRGRLRSVIIDTRLWRVNGSVFMLHFLLISAFSVFPLLLRGTGEIEDSEHASYYLGLLVTSFVLMLPLMWLSDRLTDTRPILFVTVSFILLAFCILLYSGAYPFVLTGMVFFFMAFNLLEVMLPAQLSKLASAGSRGTAMGVYTTLQFLGIFAGGVVSGAILGSGVISNLLYANIAICGLWLGLCLTFPRLGSISSRTVQLSNLRHRSAQEGMDALLSVPGVIDVVIIEVDNMAYLKVDESAFDDRELEMAIAGTGSL